jgi:hypothetical protein
MKLQRVLDAAMLSSLAHKTKEQVQEALKGTDYIFNRFVSDGFLQCYIARSKNNSTDQVIVFRESTDRKDWIANLNFFEEQTPHGIFHGAYYRKLQKIMPELMSYLYDKSFVAIGFSQGAALARMFAYLSKKQYLTTPFFVAFEPPQESKKEDYNPFGIYTTRGNDIVPMIPLELTGWQHSGTHIHILGKNGKFCIDPRRWNVALDRARSTIIDIKSLKEKGVPSLDHSIFRIRGDWEREDNKKKIIALCT